jgi:nifR3 family TIM-barrel protein
MWSTLKKPIIGLAPMDGVTDAAFRIITKKYGGPDIMFTEFTSVEGWCRGSKDWKRNLMFDESERPIIAQIYGKTPEFFYESSKKIAKMGFDGVDINMGCPSKSVNNSGAGAALIKTPKLAQEIVAAVQNGVNKKIPVSIKTRLGYEENIIDKWLSLLLETKPVAITLHGRTFKEGYKGQADWESIGRAAKIAKGSGVLILGNGDVQSRKDGEEKCQKYGVDGVLIGRAAYGNPWIFLNDQKKGPNNIRPVRKNKVDSKRTTDFSVGAAYHADPNIITKVVLEHAQIFEKMFQQFDKGEGRYFQAMRKHLAWYIKGFEGAKEIRQKLVRANNSEEVKKILSEIK